MKLLFTVVSKSFSSPKNPFSSSVPSLIAVLYGFSPLCCPPPKSHHKLLCLSCPNNKNNVPLYNATGNTPAPIVINYLMRLHN